MATLIVTPFTPREGSGRGLRTVGIARALARVDDVEISYVQFDGTRAASSLERDPGITLRPLRATRGLRRGVEYARARRAGTPRAFARGVSDALLFAPGELERFDRVVADGPTAGAALVLLGGHSRIVYNAHNLESRFRLKLSRASRDYGSPAQLLDFERRLLARSLETWLPSRAEVTEALELVPDAAVRYIPNVVDVSSIVPVSRPHGLRVLFVADFSYEPNRNAARLLVDDVMPRLWRIVPRARLALVGRSLELPASTDERIDLLGFVEELHDVYATSACAVVPLREGGGSPLKLIEAMAYGLPVVATSVAASGLDEAVDGTHYVEADEPEGLAKSIAGVLTGSTEIGRNGRQLAEDEYSIESLVGHFEMMAECP